MRRVKTREKRWENSGKRNLKIIVIIIIITAIRIISRRYLLSENDIKKIYRRIKKYSFADDGKGFI